MSLITISQGIGSDGTIIAQRVAEGLELELYDDLKIKQETLEIGLEADKLKDFDGKAPGFLDRLLGRRPDVYLDLMHAVIYKIAQKGQGVIVGHGSQVLLHDFDCALHVLIHASLPSRIEKLMETKGMSQDIAANLVSKSDNEKKGFFQFAYHKNWDDPGLYDVCLNPGKVGIKMAADLIIQISRSPGLKACSLKALETMSLLSQVKQVEAALIKKGVDLSLLDLKVVEKGVVDVGGMVHTHEEKEKIRAIISSVPGIVKVRLEISTRTRAFA